MTFARRPQGVLSRIVPDRRRYKRIAVTLLGRFMRESKEEHPCKLIDISAGGAAVTARRWPCPWASAWSPISTTSAASRALVVREFDGGFAFSITATQTQAREARRAADLARQPLRARRRDEPPPRAHQRRPTREQTLQLAEGITLSCRVLDVSISGASIATPARPEIGTRGHARQAARARRAASPARLRRAVPRHPEPHRAAALLRLRRLGTHAAPGAASAGGNREASRRLRSGAGGAAIRGNGDENLARIAQPPLSKRQSAVRYVWR